MTYRFEDVEVDAGAFRVTKAGEPVRLEPKAIELLLFLARNPGRLVTKAEIQEAVWRDTSVTENALTRLVAQIRKGLGDDAREARYIETVPTRGYRFVAALAPGGTAPFPRRPHRVRLCPDSRIRPPPPGRPGGGQDFGQPRWWQHSWPSRSSASRPGAGPGARLVPASSDPLARGREADQHQRHAQRLPALLTRRLRDRVLDPAARLDGDRRARAGARREGDGDHQRRPAERPAHLLAGRAATGLPLRGARRDLARARTRRRPPPADPFRLEPGLVARRHHDRVPGPVVGRRERGLLGRGRGIDAVARSRFRGRASAAHLDRRRRARRPRRARPGRRRAA